MNIYKTSEHYYSGSREIIIQDERPFMVVDDIGKQCYVRSRAPVGIYLLDGQRYYVYYFEYGNLPPVFICINMPFGKFVAKVER